MRLRTSPTRAVAAIAVGCAAFVSEAQRDPAWSALIARGAWAFPTVAAAARERLKTNLRLAQAQERLACFSTEVGYNLVFGIVLQAMRSASESRLSPGDVLNLIQGILRALGVSTEDAECALRRLDKMAAAMQGAGSAAATNLIQQEGM